MPKLANLSQNVKVVEITTSDLSKISALTAPQHTLALVKFPEYSMLTTEMLKGSFTFALDGIQDPGNLGTIIRTVDWFGMTRLICSEDTVDVYNSKVVQATMGSLSRVRVQYTALDQFLQQREVPVFGALLNGKSIYETNFGNEGIVFLGNEGNGLRPEILSQIRHSVTIPRFGAAESLNVAVTASIFCSEMRRNS